MNSEEDEFRRIEREALRLWAAQTDDDDTQVYAKPWQGLTDEEMSDIVANMDVNFGDLLWKVVCLTKIIGAKLKERNT